MAPGTEGGVTRHQPSNKKMSIYDAAIEYAKSETPLVIFAGKEYGTGSSRDWAAKGTRLLGVRAVVCGLALMVLAMAIEMALFLIGATRVDASVASAFLADIDIGAARSGERASGATGGAEGAEARRGERRQAAAAAGRPPETAAT